LDTCFSGPQLLFLSAVCGVLQSVVLTLFWGWIRSLQDSVREARAERDRAAGNLEDALHLGETAVKTTRRRG
jgi:hypothetical protein